MFVNIVIGISLALAGALMRILRVRRNYFIGYRTPASMKDEKSWVFANKLAATYMIVVGLLSTLFGLVNHYLELASYHVVIIVTLGMLALAIILIEVSLKKRASK